MTENVLILFAGIAASQPFCSCYHFRGATPQDRILFILLCGFACDCMSSTTRDNGGRLAGCSKDSIT